MELSIFDELKVGANFNSKHNKEHLQSFKQASELNVRDEYRDSSQSVPDSLDFFGSLTKKGPSQKQRGGSRKNTSKQQSKKPISDKSTKTKQTPLLLMGEGANDSDNSSDSDSDSDSSSDSNNDSEARAESSSGDDSDDDDDDDDDAAGSKTSGLLLFGGSKEAPPKDPKGLRQKGKAKSSATSDVSKRQRREQINAFRHRMNIRIKGSDVCDPIATFEEMQPCGDAHIKAVLLHNIEKSLYKEPTPIQMQAVPILLRHRDVLAAAPTGSGKTAAFVLPILASLAIPAKKKLKQLRPKSGNSTKAGIVRSIIVAPTRELATQIQREVTKLSEGKKFRAVVLSKATMHSVANNPTDVLVTTPLRLLGALQSGQIDASELEYFVLDEADKLFEMGFVEQLDQILAQIKAPGLTRAFFSATLPEGVEDLARSVLVDPVRVVIGVRNAGASTIDQQLKFVGQEQGKLQAMRHLIAEGLKPPCILFVQSKERAVEVFQELVYEGINVEVLHADRTQAQRDRIVDQFRIGKIWVLIATDIVARGLDFQGVNTVINFDFPQSSVSYVHRIGRTGRAGRRGKAITFFTESDFPALRSIANVMKISGCEVPEWMLRLKTMKTKDKRRLRKSAPKRHSIRTTTAYDKKRKAHRDNMVSQTSKESHRRKQARKKRMSDNKASADNDDDGWTLVTS